MRVRFAVALVMGALIGFALSAVLPEVAFANHCPVGVECYCDKVRPGAPLADPQLLWCEDWETPNLHDNVNVGGGAPNFGPPWDATGGFNRGDNSYWVRNYGYPGSNCLWANGRPASPTLGSPCSGGACGMPVYHPTNLWNGNAEPITDPGRGAACIAFPRSGEFNSEGLGITEPGHASGGGTGAFSGRQTFAQRVQRGVGGRLNDIVGWVSFGAPKKTIGITMAMAYASNSGASGIWNAPWKHNEWTVGGNAQDSWVLFHNTPPLQDSDPFQQFFFDGGCNSKIGSAVIRRGQIFCDAGNNMLFWPSTSATVANGGYRQSRDWPFGQWACVRGYITGIGTAALKVQIWFQGPNDAAERLIIDFDYNGVGMTNAPGYDGLALNAYANTNQGFLGTGETPTTATTYRYEDTIHIRAGVPVSCAQIGYGVSGPRPSPPPAAPTLQ